MGISNKLLKDNLSSELPLFVLDIDRPARVDALSNFDLTSIFVESVIILSKF